MFKKIVLLVLFLVTPMMAFSLFEEKVTDEAYINVITSVKDVILVTAKTRGLTNSFNNGNVAAQLLVYAQREDMEKDLQALESAGKKAKLSEANMKTINTLQKKLKSLNNKAFRKNPEFVFAAYTAFIDDMLQFNNTIIDTYFKGSNPSMYKPLYMMNNILLPLTENIGKLRGMGSGIVARGRCNANETPKMKHFSEEIEKYRLEMAAYYKSNGCQRFSARKLTAFNKAIAEFTKLSNEKVIGKSTISLDANEYFEQGSASINNIVGVYDGMLQEIKKRL